MSSSGVIWYVHPYAGGPGVGRYDRPFHLAKHWQAAGYAPVVITTANHHLLDGHFPNGGQIIESVPYHFIEAPTYSGNGMQRLLNMFGFSAKLFTQARTLVAAYGRPRMIIASSPHPYAFPPAYTLARRYGARSVFEVRDLWPLSLVELAGVSPRHPLVLATDMIERYAYRQADYTVSLLPNAQEHMVSRGLNPDRFRHIPNGIEPEASSPGPGNSPAIERARDWRAHGAFVIVYAGAIGRPNNVASLVQAVLDLRDRGEKGIKAIVIGRGERTEQLSELISERGGEDTIALYGQVPKAEVRCLFRETDAGYLSLLPEPLFRFGISPNKLFDYMQARLPIISAVSAGNDPVLDASCGFSACPEDVGAIGDAILRLARLSPAERQSLGDRGHEYVLAHHGYDRLAGHYLSLLGDPSE